MKTRIQFLQNETSFAKFPFNNYEEKAILKAMGRFAEQEAKEFVKWVWRQDPISFDFDELYKKFKNGKPKLV